MASPSKLDFSSSTPLTEADYRKLNKALDRLAKAWRDLERAEQAGLDMTEQRRLLEYAEKQIDQRKKVYFKGKP